MSLERSAYFLKESQLLIKASSILTLNAAVCFYMSCFTVRMNSCEVVALHVPLLVEQGKHSVVVPCGG